MDSDPLFGEIGGTVPPPPPRRSAVARPLLESPILPTAPDQRSPQVKRGKKKDVFTRVNARVPGRHKI